MFLTFLIFTHGKLDVERYYLKLSGKNLSAWIIIKAWTNQYTFEVELAGGSTQHLRIA